MVHKQPIIDSLDWQHRNASELNRIVVEQAVPGSIVLMHDIHPTTSDGMPNFFENII